MPLFKTGVEQAVADVRKLFAARVQLEERREKASDEIELLRRAAPAFDLSSILNGNDGAAKSLATTRRAKVRELEDELESLAGVQRPLLEKLEQAMRAVQAAKAEEARKKAEGFRKSLDAHNTKVRELQLTLELLEECPFAPKIWQVAADSGERGWQFAIAKSARLQNELDAMVAEADAIASKPVNIGGAAESESIEGLLAAIEQAEATTIPPTRRAVENWYLNALAVAEHEWQRTVQDEFDPRVQLNRSMSISLCWGPNGEIRESDSRVRINLQSVERALEHHYT
jgi:hypothetical protein